MGLPSEKHVPTRLLNRCGLAVATAAMALGSTVSAADSAWQEFEAKRVSRLQLLAGPVERCIERRDTEHPVFHGCVDWHSAVHGHWALLRVASSGGDPRLVEIVRQSMAPAAMQAEADFILANPRFEMPYGRAWFLKLITEYETTTDDRQFRYFGDGVADSLRLYLLSRECRLGRPTYLNQSWAYRHLLEYYEHTNRSEHIQTIRARVAACDSPSLKLDRDHRKAEFFSVFANLAHLYALALEDDDFDRWHAASRPGRASLSPVTQLQTPAHHFGINLSRAWGMWSLYARTGDQAYRRSYLSHIDESLRRHESNLEDYYGYGRWVPQFAIYAISVSERRD